MHPIYLATSIPSQPIRPIPSDLPSLNAPPSVEEKAGRVICSGVSPPGQFVNPDEWIGLVKTKMKPFPIWRSISLNFISSYI